MTATTQAAPGMSLCDPLYKTFVDRPLDFSDNPGTNNTRCVRASTGNSDTANESSTPPPCLQYSG